MSVSWRGGLGWGGELSTRTHRTRSETFATESCPRLRVDKRSWSCKRRPILKVGGNAREWSSVLPPVTMTVLNKKNGVVHAGCAECCAELRPTRRLRSRRQAALQQQESSVASVAQQPQIPAQPFTMTRKRAPDMQIILKLTDAEIQEDMKEFKNIVVRAPWTPSGAAGTHFHSTCVDLKAFAVVFLWFCCCCGGGGGWCRRILPQSHAFARDETSRPFFFTPLSALHSPN